MNKPWTRVCRTMTCFEMFYYLLRYQCRPKINEKVIFSRWVTNINKTNCWVKDFIKHKWKDAPSVLSLHHSTQQILLVRGCVIKVFKVLFVVHSKEWLLLFQNWLNFVRNILTSVLITTVREFWSKWCVITVKS